MVNGSRQAASSKDQEDRAAEHMEGITAPPASPADTNPSTANRAADKEAHKFGLNHSPTLKHREITSPGSDSAPPGHVQAASTMVVHPEQAVIISNEPQSDSTDKPNPHNAIDTPDASPQSPMNNGNEHFAEQITPSAKEPANNEQKVRNQGERTRTEKVLEHTHNTQASSPSQAAKVEPRDSIPKEASDSLNSIMREPESESNAKTGPTSSQKPECSPTDPKSAISDEKPSEEERQTREEDTPAPPSNRSGDETRPCPGESEVAVNHGKHSGTRGKSGTQHESSTSPQHLSKGQVADRMVAKSKTSRDAGVGQGQSVVKEEVEEAERMKTIEDLPSESEIAVAPEGLPLADREEKKSTNNVKGAGTCDEVGHQQNSSNEANLDDSDEKSVFDDGIPHASNVMSPDADEGAANDKDISKEAKKIEHKEDKPTNMEDEQPDSGPALKPAVEKMEAVEETSAAELAATLMEIDPVGQQTELLAEEGKMEEEKESEYVKKPAEKGPIDASNTGNFSEDVVREGTPSKTDTGLEKQALVEDENMAQSKKSRKNVRKASQSRLLRTRSTSRGGAPDSSFDSIGKQDSAPQEAGIAPVQKSSDTASQASRGKDGVAEDDGPRPVMEAKGLAMRVANAVFVTEDQLDEPKIARLKDKKVLPFERLTFKELRTYNRDQLRAYCFAYGMERRKKTEMEADMARYLSYWNRGKPGFALHEYIPTSGRIVDIDEFFGNRGSQANQSAGSLGGSSYSGVDANRRFGSRVQSASGAYGDKGSGAGVHGSGSGNLQTSPSTQSAGNVNRNARAGSTPTTLPRGFGTSFKQRVHARQASAKFKAAYNGAGDTIVNVVENAAAYFEGKDSPEVIADQTKSFERYQFNVDLLTEIFDGPIQEDVEVPKISVIKANGNMEGTTEQHERGNNATTSGVQTKTDVMLDIAKRLISNKRSAHQAELDSFETNLKRAEEKAKHTERRNMRLFQKLERAETVEQVEAIKKEFETEFGTPVDFTSRPVIRRRIDKTLPPLVMPDDQSRILRFTFL